MTRRRALTQLELIPATDAGWVEVRWRRADGTRGSATAELARKTESEWYVRNLLVGVPTGPSLRDIPIDRINAAVNADERIRRWGAEGVKQRSAPRRKLKRPASHRLNDQFYREVAAAYISAVNHGLRPAKTLADDSDTPQGTVNKWIATAREKGFLPKTTPGKERAHG